MESDLNLTPIGVVHGDAKNRSEVPVGGGPAQIEVFASYAAGLDEIDKNSHVVVISYLHQADRSVLRVRQRGPDPNIKERGVFASRSPDRPSPLSLTIAPLLRREGRLLHVTHIDLADQTPVVDLKPYCPGLDSVFWAVHRHRYLPAQLDDSRLVEYLERDLENHMGAASRCLPARLALAAVVQVVRRWGRDPRDPELTVRVSRCDETVDALMGLMGAAFFNHRLSVAPDSGPAVFRFVAGPESLELVAPSGTGGDDPDVVALGNRFQIGAQ